MEFYFWLTSEKNSEARSLSIHKNYEQKPGLGKLNKKGQGEGTIRFYASKMIFFGSTYMFRHRRVRKKETLIFSY